MATGENITPATDGLDDGAANGAGAVRTRKPRTARDQSGDNRDGVAVSEAGESDGVEVAEGEAGPTWDKEASIALRLLNAQREVATLSQDAEIKGRTKSGGEYKYKGITSAQIVQRAKEVLTKHGILYWPEHDPENVKTDGNQTAVYLVGMFINVDKTEDRAGFGAWGSDADSTGKGFQKALTNANKQVLSKALMMSTTEEETTQDTQHEPTVRSETERDAEALSDVAVKSWADAFKAALDGCKSLADLKKVRSENAAMMNNPRVPQVTKDFFVERILHLEGMLE